MALLGKKKLFVFLFDRPTRMLAGPLGRQAQVPDIPSSSQFIPRNLG